MPVERGVWFVTAASSHALSKHPSEPNRQMGLPGRAPSRHSEFSRPCLKIASHHTGLAISIGVSACCEDVSNRVAAYVLAKIQGIFI